MTTSDTQAEDARLLRLVALHSRDAFEMLYDRYAGQVYGIAQRILEDRSASEEVTQETFLRLWRRAEQFDAARGNVRSWLLTMAHRLAIDALRRRRVRRALGLDRHSEQQAAEASEADLQPGWDIRDEDADVHEEAALNISRQRVRQAIAGLSEPHRRVIELAFFSGLTHREIAERLGEPLGTVHSRARQALLMLRQKLPELGPEPGLNEA
ncbi:MAG: sigma-70 family RNA polymerase sigma factor [Anaerolineae bacterium]|nr:sigma-70 family RNA polymerase sigma factor [Thermoflexales bacterium]MDW8408306.1 sigma-70 family RNA polymerase sigma factor [Anaerolineae bacterium]